MSERENRSPPPSSLSVGTVPCPCTLIEQDEDCPVGYPSMLCGICEGKGHTTQEQVTALACEMIKIANDVGEPEDPFAAWESVSLLQSQREQILKSVPNISSAADAYVAEKGIEHSGGIVEAAFEAGARWSARAALATVMEGDE